MAPAPRGNQNARRHGLTAAIGPTPPAWRELVDAAAAHFGTADRPIEAALAARVAALIGRLADVAGQHTAALAAAISPPPTTPTVAVDDADELDQVISGLLGRLSAPQQTTTQTTTIDLLCRYEAHLQRCLLATLAALHAARRLRAEEASAMEKYETTARATHAGHADADTEPQRCDICGGAAATTTILSLDGQTALPSLCPSCAATLARVIIARSTH